MGICKWFKSLELYKEVIMLWSGRRDSNPRQPAWKAGTLATELRPQSGLFVVLIVIC